jgi:hypothetical protein
VQPTLLSSTNASPMSEFMMVPSTERNVVCGVFGRRDVTIRVKSRSHRKGPRVEP